MAIVHEGASVSSRLGRWGTRSVSPTEEVTADLQTLRNRTRTLRRDSAISGRPVIVDSTNVIGTGIKPVPNTGNKELDDRIKEAHDEFIYDCDYSNSRMTLYQIQKLARKSQFEAGSGYIILKKMRSDSTLSIPLQLQVLESDYCPISLNKELNNGNQIINGIELDPFSRKVAYWFLKKPPNLRRSRSSFSPDEFVRILSKDVIHLYDQERPNQLHGRPKQSNSIVASHSFDSYNDSELTRKATRSALTGVIERDSYEEQQSYQFDPITGAPLNEDATSSIPEFDLEAGTFPALMAGERLNLFNADETSNGYADFQRFQLMQLASSAGIPLELVSGDFSQINDRIWRAIRQAYNRQIEQEQSTVIIPQMVRPIYRAFIDRGVLVDAFGDTNVRNIYKAHYRAQPFPHIHPEQDINAFIKKMRAGLATRSEYIEEYSLYGLTVEDIDTRRYADLQSEEDLGMKSLAEYDTLDSPDAPEPEPEPNPDQQKTTARNEGNNNE